MGENLSSYQFLAYPIFRLAHVGKVMFSILNNQKRRFVPTLANPHEQCSTPWKNGDVLGISWNIDIYVYIYIYVYIIGMSWQSPIYLHMLNSTILSHQSWPSFQVTELRLGASDLPEHSDLQLSNCHAVTGALKSRNTSATVVVVPAATGTDCKSLGQFEDLF